MGPSVSTGLARAGALAACAAALAGCGGSGHQPAPARVRLQVSSPSDGSQVHTSSVTISGSVKPPGATVLVLGRPVPVAHGSFSAQVQLAPGVNIVDVLAGAPRARSAMNAVRVTRQVYVQVPDLGGADVSDAQDQLTALGLVPQVKKSDPFYAILLPESDAVCETSPAGGAHVAPGSTVTVTVSKTC
jgi:hypothetical protein